MAKFFDELNDKHIKFINEQHMFFVSTAPKEGRINLSPKGLDTFRVISPTEVAYLDFTGSGNETAAHLLDDGRITIMMTSFTRNPMIFRIYGTGTAHGPETGRFKELMPLFDECAGIRQIFTITIDNIQTSCGYAVPIYELVEERETLTKWAKSKGNDGVKDYFNENNLTSIDGLPTQK